MNQRSSTRPPTLRSQARAITLLAPAFIACVSVHSFAQLASRAPDLQPADPLVNDFGPLGVSLRKIQRDPRLPQGFERIYKVAPLGSEEDERYARLSGAITAVFRRSQYTQVKSGTQIDVPSGTVFYIGGLPGPSRYGYQAPESSNRGISTARGGSLGAAVEPVATRVSQSTDTRVDGRADEQGFSTPPPPPAPTPPQTNDDIARPRPRQAAANTTAPCIFTDERYRVTRVRELLAIASSAR